MLTNRGACFTLEPDHPEYVSVRANGPMHTIIPALAMRNGRCDMSFGVMGAHYQPMGHVQIILNMLDYGMDVQQAIDAPRFFFEGEKTDVEHGTPAATIDGLEGARTRRGDGELALGRCADHQDRLGSRRADRRLGAAQGRLRARLLDGVERRGSPIGGQRHIRLGAAAFARLRMPDLWSRRAARGTERGDGSSRLRDGLAGAIRARHQPHVRLGGFTRRIVASDWHTVASFSSGRIAIPFQFRTEANSS